MIFYVSVLSVLYYHLFKASLFFLKSLGLGPPQMSSTSTRNISGTFIPTDIPTTPLPSTNELSLLDVIQMNIWSITGKTTLDIAKEVIHKLNSPSNTILTPFHDDPTGFDNTPFAFDDTIAKFCRNLKDSQLLQLIDIRNRTDDLYAFPPPHLDDDLPEYILQEELIGLCRLLDGLLGEIMPERRARFFLHLFKYHYVAVLAALSSNFKIAKDALQYSNATVGLDQFKLTLLATCFQRYILHRLYICCRLGLPNNIVRRLAALFAKAPGFDHPNARRLHDDLICFLDKPWSMFHTNLVNGFEWTEGLAFLTFLPLHVEFVFRPPNKPKPVISNIASHFHKKQYLIKENLSDLCFVYEAVHDINMMENINPQGAEIISPQGIFSYFTANPKLDKGIEEVTTLNAHLEHFRDCFDKVTFAAMSRTWTTLTAAIITIVAIYRSPNTEMSIYVAALFASAFPIPITDIALSAVVSFAKQLTQPSSDPDKAPIIVPQAGEDVLSTKPHSVSENPVLALWHVFVNMFKSTTDDVKKNDARIVKNYQTYHTLLRSTHNIVDWSMSFFKWIFQELYQFITGHPYGDEEFQALYADAHDIAVAIDAEFPPHLSSSPLEDHDSKVAYRYINRVLTLEQTRRNLEQRLFAKGITREHHWATFWKILDRLKTHYNAVHQYLLTHRARARPVVIWFVGPPNSGKSNLPAFITCDMMNSLGMTFSADSIYDWRSTREFHESYAFNFAVLMDDWLQKDDSEIRTDACLDVIYMENDSTFDVNMAAIDKKGVYPFTSRLVFLTSNNFLPANILLENTDALLRRIDFLVYVDVKDEFKGTTETGQPCLLVDGFRRDIFHFRILNSMNYTEQITATDYSTLLSMIATRYDKKNHSSASLVNSLVAQQDITKKVAPISLVEVRRLEKELLLKEPSLTKWTPPPVKAPHERKFQQNHNYTQTERIEEPKLNLLKMECNEIIEPQMFHWITKFFYADPSPVPQSPPEPERKYKAFSPDVVPLPVYLQGIKEEAETKYPITKALLGVIGITSFAYGAFKLYRYLTASPEQKENGTVTPPFEVTASPLTEPQMKIYPPQAQNIVPRTLVSPMRKKLVPFDMTTRPQAGSDSAVDTVINNCLIPNLYQLTAVSLDTKNNEKHTLTVNAQFIKGSLFYTTKHIVYLASQYSLLHWKLSNKNRAYTISPDQIKWFSLPDEDIIFGKVLDKSFPQLPNIIKHFVKESALANATNPPLKFVRLDEHLTPVVHDCGRNAQYVGSITYNKDAKYIVSGNSSTMQVVGFKTHASYCGGTYVIDSNDFPQKFFGCHIAGSDAGNAYFVYLTFEQLNEAALMDEPESIAPQVKDLKVKDLLDLDNPPEPAFDYTQIQHFEFMGVVPNSHRVHIGADSPIEKSILHGVFEAPTTHPAHGKKWKDANGIEHYPLLDMLKKIDKPVNSFTGDEELLDRICEWMVTQIPTLVTPRVLSIVETINGVTGWAGSVPLTLDTSPGTWRNTEPHLLKGKFDYFTHLIDSDTYLPTDETLADWDAMRREFLGELPPRDVVWSCQMKMDERRPLKDDKYKVPRPTFTCPLPLLLLSRQYNDAYVVNMKQARGSVWSKVGINPMSSEWEDLYRYLTTYGPKTRQYPGDYNTYDWTKVWATAVRALQIREEWYKRDPDWTPDDEAIRRGIFAATRGDSSSGGIYFIVANMIFRAPPGRQPSGDHLTTNSNCDENFMTLAYILYDIYCTWARDSGHVPMPVEQFLALLKIAVFGDDNVPALPPSFTFVTMEKIHKGILRLFGQIWTPADKILDWKTEYYTIDQVDFLKRSFADDKTTGRKGALARLREEVIHEIPNWTTKKVPRRIAASQNCETALREWFLYGREIFNLWKSRYNAALLERGAPPVTKSYLELLTELSPVYARLVTAPVKLLIDPYEVIEPQMFKTVAPENNPKNVLQEKRQKANLPLPVYKIRQVGGDLSAPQLVATCIVDDKQVDGPKSLSKKEAEKNAAAMWLMTFDPLSSKPAPERELTNMFKKLTPVDPTTPQPQVRTITEVDHLRLQVKMLENRLLKLEVFLARNIPGFHEEVIVPQCADLSEKQENTAPVTTLVGITTFDDLVGKNSPELENIKFNLYDGLDPYPDQEMKKVLSRVYPILNFTWSGASTRGTMLQSFYFPGDLIASSTFLSEKLHRFQWFAADTRVSFRISSTPFHSGKLLIAWIPSYQKGTSDSNAMQDIWAASCQNAVILSANTTVAPEIVIPYVNPYGYWNMADDYTTTAKGFFGTVKVFVLHQLTLGGAVNTPTVPITVYASFENTRLAGMGLRANVPEYKLVDPDNNNSKDDFHIVPQCLEVVKRPPYTKLIKMDVPEDEFISPQSVDAVTDMRIMFEAPFEGLIPIKIGMRSGVVSDDSPVSFTELLHRYSDWTQGNIGTGIVQSRDAINFAHGDIHTFQRVRRGFLFYKGGYRVKLNWQVTAASGNTVDFWVKVRNHVAFPGYNENVLTNEFDMAGIHMVSNKMASFLELEVPYYAEYFMNDHFFQRSGPLFSIGHAYTGNLWFTQWLATADDTSLGWPLAGLYLASSGTVKAPQKKEIIRPQSSSSKEQMVKSTQGVVSGVLEGVSKISTSLTKVPVLSNTASKVTFIANKLLGAAKHLGLSKPTSLETTRLTNQIGHSGFVQMRGLDCAVKLTCDPQEQVGNDPEVFRSRKNYDMFDNYKLLPGLIWNGAFDATFTSGTKIDIIGCTPTYVHNTIISGPTNTFFLHPVANYASYFGYWTGSLKYHMMFTTSKFTTGRIRVTWLPDPTFNAAIINEQEGDTVSKVIDICGDTSVSFTVPWVGDKPFRKVITPLVATNAPITQWSGFNGQLFIQVINPLTIQNALTTATCQVAIWMSGGEDFHCIRPCDLWNGYSDVTTADA
jgi:hypothetical protein